jgi:drug/metabolite transporter (DMT)-like permease
LIYNYLLILLSGVLIGISALIEKATLRKEHSVAYATSVALIAAVISFTFIPFVDLNISILDIFLLYIVSLLSTTTAILAAKVYKHGNISVVSPILSSIPQFIIIVLALAFLNEKLSPIKYVSIAVIIVATYLLISNKNKRSKSFDKKYYIYILIVLTLLMAIGATILKYLLFSIQPLTYLLFLSVFTAINGIAYMQIKFGGLREIVKNTMDYKYPIIAIAIITITYRLLYYLALVNTFVSIAYPLRNTLNILITVILGGLLFGEKNIKRKLLLSIILMIAVYTLIV